MTYVSEVRQLDECRGAMADMTWIAGGTFQMGSDTFYPEERPSHAVTVDGFWIERCPVTNEEFARFVDATGYVTVAERAPRAEAAQSPGADLRFDQRPQAGSLSRSDCRSCGAGTSDRSS